jgi:carboxynorspermidine decarboxylase
MEFTIDVSNLQTPCYLVDERLLERNLRILDSVQQKTGCSILLALKGFSMFSTFPLIGNYLAGVTASSLHEARLGYEEMGNRCTSLLLLMWRRIRRDHAVL